MHRPRLKTIVYIGDLIGAYLSRNSTCSVREDCDRLSHGKESSVTNGLAVAGEPRNDAGGRGQEKLVFTVLEEGVEPS